MADTEMTQLLLTISILNSVTFFKSQLIKPLRKRLKCHQTLIQVQYYDWYRNDSRFDNNLNF